MQRSATRAGLVVLLTLATCAFSYAQSDSVLWVYLYSGPGDDVPLVSFVDDTGNVYIVGRTERETTRRDILLLKLDSLGREVWVRTYDHGRNRNDDATGAVRDTDGNIYIVAAVSDSTGDRVCLLKYNPGGDLVWVRTYGEANRDYDRGMVVLDDSQNVYVGCVTQSTTYPLARVVKYKPNGDLVWVKGYTANGYKSIWDFQLHLLADGAAYLAFEAEHPQRRNDWLIAKLSPAGAVQWERVYKDTGTAYEGLWWSQVDEAANIHLTGSVVSATSRTDAFCTMKIDSSGNVLWVREYNSPENLQDVAQHVLLHQGQVYVAGWSVFVEKGEYTMMTLVKYDSLGNELWVRQYAGGDTCCMLGYRDYDTRPPFRPMSADSEGNVYLTGGAYYDRIPACYAVTLKYDSLGNRAWVRKYAEQERSWHGGQVEPSRAGALHVIGVAARKGEWDIFALKYRGR